MTTRPYLESDSYRDARKIIDAGTDYTKDPVKELEKWKRKNKGKDPITGMPLAHKNRPKPHDQIVNS